MGPQEGRSADRGYLWSESVSRQADSREKAGPDQSGSHFAETWLFRPGSHLAEIVVPSETVTDKPLRFIRQLYGASPAVAFGPVALANVRQAMVASGRSRKLI